jgi:hypothetical protein
MRKAIVLAALLLAACSNGGSHTAAPTSTIATTTTIPPNSTPTTIKVPTAREFIEGFKRRGLPVGKVVCYTDESDPNHLLNRPGGYVEKCDWADKRQEQLLANKDSTDPDSGFDLVGGSVETFERPGGAAERAAYLHGFEGSGALSPGYTYQPKNANWVLRIDVELTKKQAEAYLKAFLAQF